MDVWGLLPGLVFGCVPRELPAGPDRDGIGKEEFLEVLHHALAVFVGEDLDDALLEKAE